MNKKSAIYRVILVGIMLTLVLTLAACKKNPPSEETILPPQETTETMVSETTEEYVPGVVDNPFGEDQDNLEETTSPRETENAGSDNTDDFEKNDSENKATTPSQDTEPEDTTAPEETKPENNDPTEAPSAENVTYEQYNAMSPEEQLAFFESFDSMEEFVRWYNDAKAKYEAENPDIEIGDGEIDVGDIIGGQ